jgi:hypothetical protein
MKKLILALAALMVSLAAYGQGQFVFNNRVPPDINAKFGLDNGVTPGSTADVYTVQLLGGPSGSAQSTWTEIGTTTFRTGNAAGYVTRLVRRPGPKLSHGVTSQGGAQRAWRGSKKQSAGRGEREHLLKAR